MKTQEWGSAGSVPVPLPQGGHQRGAEGSVLIPEPAKSLFHSPASGWGVR